MRIVAAGLLFVGAVVGLVVWLWPEAAREKHAQVSNPVPQEFGSAENQVSPARQAFEESIAVPPTDLLDPETMLRDALAEWAVYEPLPAKKWLEEHATADDAVNSKRQGALAISWAESDAAAAAAYVTEFMAPGVDRNVALVSVIQRWAQQDPAIAGKFVFGLKDATLQQNAAVELVAIWADKDTAPPAQWIQSLPVSPLRDVCSDRLAREIAAEAPEAARAWAGEIRDTSLREKCLAAIADLHLPE